MLILTRQSKDKISFPQVGITIHFIQLRANFAKVGVDAPRDLAIVREEISNADAAASLVRKRLLQLPREVRHGIRNELHQISVGMHLYKELMNAGLTDEASDTFESLLESLRRLDDNHVLQRPDGEPAGGGIPSTVLVIEDDDNEREMLAGFLRLRGFHVLSFPDGDEALSYMNENDSPKFVLVDMKMPRCDGPTTIRRIRESEKFSKTSVFAISGTSPKENGIPTGSRGVDRWFQKPLNPQFLVDAISTASSSNN